MPLHTIQRWLGHTNISQTSTYLAVTDTGSHEAMAKFDQVRVATLPQKSAEPIEEADLDVDTSENWQESDKAGAGKWSGRLDSNQRHLAPKASALPG